MFFSAAAAAAAAAESDIIHWMFLAFLGVWLFIGNMNYNREIAKIQEYVEDVEFSEKKTGEMVVYVHQEVEELKQYFEKKIVEKIDRIADLEKEIRFIYENLQQLNATNIRRHKSDLCAGLTRFATIKELYQHYGLEMDKPLKRAAKIIRECYHIHSLTENEIAEYIEHHYCV